MNRFWLAAALIPALVACTVPEEDFPEAYGKACCQQFRTCNEADYEAEYDDAQDCRDDWAVVGEDLLLGQTYSEEKATDCLGELKDASCEDFKNANYDCEVFE